MLTEHLGDEEANILPLIADHLTLDEWDEVGHRGRAALSLGAVPEASTPEEQRHFVATVPVPERLPWTVIGRRRYRRHVAELRGGLA